MVYIFLFSNNLSVWDRKYIQYIQDVNSMCSQLSSLLIITKQSILDMTGGKTPPKLRILGLDPPIQSCRNFLTFVN